VPSCRCDYVNGILWHSSDYLMVFTCFECNDGRVFGFFLCCEMQPHVGGVRHAILWSVSLEVATMSNVC
jgi:hypothetical protein